MTADILNGSFEPGRHLGEVELAERFGVSRQSLRSAMAELVHLGLLRREANRGYRVPILTQADVEDLYRMRRIIESEAIRELAGGGHDLAEVEAAVTRLESLPEDAPWSDVVDADVTIHRAIVAAAGSPRMSEAYDLLGAQFRLSTVPARRYIPVPQMATAHRQLLRSITHDGADIAVVRLHEHLEWGSDQLFSYLEAGLAEAR